jgi:hypothetical protein
MAGVYLDYLSNKKAVVRFVDTSGAMPWANLVLSTDLTFDYLNVSRVMWTGADWTVTGANGSVVIDTGSAPWGVLDFGERGTSIRLANSVVANVAANTAFTANGTTGMLVLELVKSA